MPEQHNGWTNFDTFQVGVLLLNTEELYTEASKMADDSDSQEELAHDLEEWVRAWWDGEEYDTELDEVDWMDVADGFWEAERG